jgi:glycosyltransferase involved in cell wall biosynthesis
MNSVAHIGATSIGLVVPVYAGEAHLERLVARVSAIRSELEESRAFVRIEELIMVDDGAIDGSPELIDRLAAQHPWIVALHMSRNYGQHAATVAGIMHSAADWIVTLDEDLQHPPEKILDLLRHAVRQGADVVYAKPTSAVHGAASRDFTSRSFKRAMSLLTGDPNLPNYNSFRMIRGPIARAAASVVSHDTYFDVCLSWFTLRTTTLPMVLTDERFQQEGRSGYSFGALVRHAGRMLLSSHLRVLRWAFVAGLTVVSLSVIAAIGLLVARLAAPELIEAPGWTSLAVLVTFFGGLITFLVGILLQYVSTLVLRAHGKPSYFLVDRSRDALIAASLGVTA